MMQNYRTPCYTLTETMEILGLRLSELHHAIRSNDLKAVVYTKYRSMLLFRRDDKSQWIGAATCTYRGHVSLHPDAIATLLDEPSLKLITGSCTLLEPDGITNWSIAYPYHKQPPHGPIVGWQPIDQEQAIAQSRAIAQRKLKSQNRPIGQDGPIGQIVAPIYACATTPLPKEFENHLKALNSWMDKFNKTREFEPLIKEAKDPNIMELDFQSNSIFSQSDLRVPVSEITKYKEQLEEQKKAFIVAQAVTSTASKTQRGRESQLHDLIERIIAHKPDISAKDTWSLIQRDSELDDPFFDIDHILQTVDANCIEWTSRNGTTQSMTWRSFQAKLSQIKKRTK